MKSDRSLSAVLSPASVALVGVSDDPTKTTGRPLAYLDAGGWQGTVYPVNPTRATVQGRRSFHSLRDLPEVPDHVMVLTAAELAIDAVADCSAMGVPVVTVLADGFTPHDPAGVQRIARIRAAATGGTRLLGPSSLGVVRPATGLRLTANAVFSEPELPGGSVVVASQSGSAIGAIVSRGKDMGIGFHSLISTGAELDLTLGELCASTVDDPEVTGYALFLEHLAGAADLRTFALRAAAASKPVVVYKLGRTPTAAALSVTHTGALAGDDAAADAFIRDLGFARVRTFDALLESMEFARAVEPAGRMGRRVAVVSTTGGGGAMAVDSLAADGVLVGGLSTDTVERLHAMGIDGSGSLIDLTLAGARYEVMRGALDILRAAPEIAAIVAVPGSSARFHPELAVRPIADAASAGGNPIACFVMPSAPDACRLLREAGVAAFRTPEACADAVAAVLARGLPTARAVPLAVPSHTTVLDEVESYRTLTDLGVRIAPYAVVGDEPLTALPVPGPAVVKILNADVPHKSDIGGVRLGITSAQELAAAIVDIRKSVRERGAGVAADRFIVQSMVTGVAEVLVGFRRDSDVGPLVVVAGGGTLAELLGASVVRIAPVDQAQALTMLLSLPTAPLLNGYRGAPKADLVRLSELVVAVSRLADESHIIEAEINPVIAGIDAAVAVDALVRVSKSP